MLKIILNTFCKNSRNTVNNEPILNQERFEPAEWTRPINEQIRLLQEVYFRDCKIDSVYLNKRLNQIIPSGYMRIAVPKLEFLRKQYGIKNAYSDIGILIENVCELLMQERVGKFTHYRKGQLGPNRIQCIPKLVEKRKEVENNVNGDIIILDVDLGNKYAGWAPRRAREDIINNKNVFALSSVDICWILLLNPSRLQRNIDLSIDAVMEEYLSEDRGWVCVLFFYFRGGKLEFGYRWGRRAYFDSGAGIGIIK